ncbi:unnamed protein product [Cuscuta epithymum]|uniref:UspA domain-containing protein n=1 Tax=Cuscuta epithymum TaxID=186058 RepID=A0AAV0EBG7_9ASTE|nr:unnamed protein product [Cuscuta epithymum]
MEGAGDKKERVMIAIDESEFSCYAIEWTLQHFHASLLNSQIVLFTVQPIVDYGYIYASSLGFTSPVPAPVAAPELVRSIQENQKNVAMALLDKATDICKKYGITAETVMEAGDPKEAICQAVEKMNIQLLVLGSHSRGALQRAFLGSVSTYCVHNANCQVLVVKKKP